uniref:GST N-terminal domain-containing protein n=2 Tax=Chromera velia CCMP2878 TaxID=1169474 RepID=A0A0G4H2N0_9ALVE|eukprot:Cvel_24405.t1-p1 / transcript=Cvel_24405.t1 / gene=Cvel_24405 / organism=Chromera_velia_CCMP2878 / gene_product=Glutaredoxin-2, putative / transcript_product=Glutaredoxin-2, putative / location=Cvel_scaffold2633:22476-25318(-) / protein_length=285 / sequence_SO=supercontig / SO=protein_coding / is_pseudo=false
MGQMGAFWGLLALSCAVDASGFLAGLQQRLRTRKAESPSRLAAVVPDDRIVPPGPLPQLYVYDHCPFCVRARIIFGLKKIKHELIWLANDEVDIPTRLVGKKMVPILVWTDPQDPQKITAMPESMDIVRRVDGDAKMGAGGPVLKETGASEEFISAMNEVTAASRRLTRPRFAGSALLPEFSFDAARRTYTERHPLDAPSSYDENFKRSSEYIPQLEKALQKLDPLLHSEEEAVEGGPSYTDVDLFPRLRGCTIVKGVKWPQRVRAYVDKWSEKTDIPLYDRIAF